MQATSEIFWTITPDGVVEDLPAWRELTGQTGEQMVGWGWLDAVHPDDRDQTSRAWRQALKKGVRFDQRYRVRRRDGAYRWFSVCAVPAETGRETAREWVGACSDITERLDTEADLQRQAEETALLYEAAGLLGRTLDPDIIYDTMHTLVARAMDCDTLLVSVYSPDDNLIRCTYAFIEGQRVDAGPFPPIPLAPEGRGMQSRVIRTGEPIRIEDVPREAAAMQKKVFVGPDGAITEEEDPDADPMATRSALMVPIKLENRVLGVAQVMSHRPAAYAEYHLRVLEALMAQVAAASRNAFLYQQAREEITERKRVENENVRLLREAEATALQQRNFLREVLAGLTEGRLRLCDTPDDLPAPLRPATEVLALSKSELRTFRAEVERVSREQALPDERWQDLMAAAGEASMNSVVHAGGGEARIHAGDDGRVQIWVRDEGPGIAEETLHRATLEQGYTTAGTLGHGFWMMLRTADSVYLLTGPSGTTVVLEQGREPPLPYWLRELETPDEK